VISSNVGTEGVSWQEYEQHKEEAVRNARKEILRELDVIIEQHSYGASHSEFVDGLLRARAVIAPPKVMDQQPLF